MPSLRTSLGASVHSLPNADFHLTAILTSDRLTRTRLAAGSGPLRWPVIELEGPPRSNAEHETGVLTVDMREISLRRDLIKGVIEWAWRLPFRRFRQAGLKALQELPHVSCRQIRVRHSTCDSPVVTFGPRWTGDAKLFMWSQGPKV